MLPFLRETPAPPSLFISSQSPALSVSGDLALPWIRALLLQTQLPGAELSPNQGAGQLCREKFMFLAASGRPDQQVLHFGAGQAQGGRTLRVPPLHLYT